MKANFTKATRNNHVSIGSLYQFELLREQFAHASHLEGNLPVLSCMVPQEHAHLLGAGRIETRVGYGRFELDEGHQLQTIQIQINGVLFAWVTDMDDDVVWGAIDVWRAVGQLPLMLRLDKGNRWQPLCAVLKAPPALLETTSTETRKIQGQRQRERPNCWSLSQAGACTRRRSLLSRRCRYDTCS